MKNNKTPGMDGLTAAFYKSLFEDIQDIFIEVYTEMNTENTVPKSMTRALTTVIPKTASCKTPSDYSPITLLNITSLIESLPIIPEYSIFFRILKINKYII